jgi:heme/copper-type cytochrome/quinol oxidase subunit 2
MEQETDSIFDMIVWCGAAIALIGLFGIVWCILRVSQAKRADLPEEEMKNVLQSVLPLNLGALFLSFLGLMIVGVGIAFS